MFSDLDRQRAASSPVLVGMLWLIAVAATVSSVVLQGPWIPLGVGALGLAAAMTVLWRMSSGAPPSLRISMAIAMMAEVSFLVAAYQGQAVQIDMHMAYFASLALMTCYCDWKAIGAAAATVAVHHLLLSFILPTAVFPGSASLIRVLLHAGILVVEAGALIWLTRNIDSMFTALGETTDKAMGAQATAERATTDARRSQAAQAEADAAHAAERQQVQIEQDKVVEALAAGLSRLASGDLTARIDAVMEGRYLKVKEDFNAALAQMQTVMTTIASAADGINHGADEIAVASHDLSRRTEQQAASLEETAAALDEITATVRRTASGAKQASEVVGGARLEAQSSGDVVRNAVEAMSAIESSSTQITQIIGVIDEIAFQTNLLALNAGVEAARAGDAGRGFAVVAQEVRALAQRAGDAARQIRGLIATSTRQVTQGVDLVSQTGRALESIVGKVAEIDALVSEISASAQEQATGLGEVNTAVNHMDQVVQQNAAMVEQSTAASTNLKAETGALTGLVGRFQLGAKTRPAASAPAAAPARPAPLRRAAGGQSAAAAFRDEWTDF